MIGSTPAATRPTTGAPPMALLAALAALTALRLVVAAVAGPIDDETYYRLWSLNLQPGYLDHAPMVAWMIRAGRVLAGDDALGLRLFGPLSTAAGTLVLWRTVALAEGQQTATRAAVWFNAMLLVGAGSVLMTPDTPAVFFWGATVWALAELTASRDARWWLAVGGLAGLGLFSKYSVLFLGLGIVLWLVSMRQTRVWLARWQLWLGGAIAVALFSPVIAWNAAHEWMSFAKQFGRTAVTELRFDTPGELIGVQLLLIGLPMVPFVGLGVVRAWRGWRAGDAMAALPLVTGLPFVAYLLVHSLHGRVEGNWPGPLYPAFAWMAAGAVTHLGDPAARVRSFLAGLARWVAPVGFALAGLVYLHVCTNAVVLPPERDPTAQMRGWDDFSRAVEMVRQRLGFGWIAASNYTMEGQLAMRLGWNAVVPMDEVERYGHLPPHDPRLFDRPGLLVMRGGREIDASVTGRFSEVTAIGHLTRQAGGKPVETYDLYRIAGGRAR